MSVTLKTIRQTLSSRSGWYRSITATSGSTSTLVDDQFLKDTGASDYDHQDCWFKCVSATQASNVGKVRRAASFSKTGGIVTFGNDLPATVTAADVFEEHQVDPVLIDSAINSALRKCTTIKRDIITYSAGDRIIDLSTSQCTWVTQTEQVLGLRYRLGTVSGQYTYQDVAPYEYKATIDTGIVSLEFLYSAPMTGTGIALELKSIGPFVVDGGELATDSATTGCPLDWVVPMALLDLLNMIGNNADLQARPILRLDRNEAALDALKATATFAPAISYEMRVDN